MTVAIYGIGSTIYGRQPHKTAHALAWQAVLEAFEDAGVSDVDAAYVGTAFGPLGAAQRCLHPLGITGVPIVRLENACASGTTAFHEARRAIEAGRYERVLVLGVEHMTSIVARGGIPPANDDPEGRQGMPPPGVYAMSARRYMHAYGLRPEQLALVAVKNHRHALNNLRAATRGELTVEQVLESRMIADPLTRLQCCGISDGAAAAVLGPERGNRRDVRIRATALRSGQLWDQRSDHVWGFELIRETSRRAFEAAELGVEDVDVIEAHDPFTIAEIVATEALGLAAEGEGGRLVESGHTSMGGEQPVNPSGGSLARGHPIAATGLAQVFEVTMQLRGEAGERQVEGARLGVVETLGGGTSGLDGNGCVVAILEGG